VYKYENQNIPNQKWKLLAITAPQSELSLKRPEVLYLLINKAA
jgi:hypothetical protein